MCHGCYEFVGNSKCQIFVSNNQLKQHLRDNLFDSYCNDYRVVHNSIDRHGPNFKKFLSKITEECEDVMIDKISLPAVESCGQMLGGDLDAVGVFTQRELVLFAAECRLAERHSKHIIMNATVSEIVNIGGSENSEVIEID